MPLDLLNNRGPIDEMDSTFQDVLKDLQGNILAGHGRLHAVHLFVHFETGEIPKVKRWISEFVGNRVISAWDQAKAADAYRRDEIDAGVFGHLALTAEGYKVLGFAGDSMPKGADPRNRSGVPPYEDVFGKGLASRQGVLLDPPQSEWEDGYKDGARPIHALVLLAADDPSELVAVERVVVAQLGRLAHVVASERGNNLRKKFRPEDPDDGVGVEHFGYVDGRSQPLFLLRQITREEPRGGGSFWDPRAPLGLVLVPDPNGTPNVSFGSFLVYRKLEQNVRAFKEAEAKLATELGLPRELVGAMAVGRYEDGTPIVLQPADGTRPIPNDFNFGGDPLGQSCPFHAHIRKTNPRLESVRFGGPFAQSVEEELGHRIARRGIPFGGPLSDSDSPAELPARGVGLLFFCYQADIWEQFEFMQRFWANNPNFLQPGIGGPGADNFDRTGLDAVVGQRIPGQSDPVINEEPTPPRNWPNAWGKPTQKVTTDFAQFVTLKGGDYFFSPSIGFLKSLA